MTSLRIIGTGTGPVNQSPIRTGIQVNPQTVTIRRIALDFTGIAAGMTFAVITKVMLYVNSSKFNCLLHFTF